MEASIIPEEVVLETTTSHALYIGEACINLNLVSKDDFNYITLNHISPTPSPIPSPNKSPKHTSLPINEPINAHNQLIEFSASEQPSPLNIMLEPPIDVSSGKATPSSSESKYDATKFEAHPNLNSS